MLDVTIPALPSDILIGHAIPVFVPVVSARVMPLHVVLKSVSPFTGTLPIHRWPANRSSAHPPELRPWIVPVAMFNLAVVR
jgi:hypothetical protein